MNSIKFTTLLLIGAFTFTVGYAQEEKDVTGTNPTIFTYDARFYFEMAELSNSTGSYLTKVLQKINC